MVLILLLLLLGTLAVAGSSSRPGPGLAAAPGDNVAAAPVAATTAVSPEVRAPEGEPPPFPALCQRVGELGLVHQVAFNGGGDWFWFLEWYRVDGVLNGFRWVSTVPTDLWVAGEKTGEHRDTVGRSAGTFVLPAHTDDDGGEFADAVTAVAFCPSTYEPKDL